MPNATTIQITRLANGIRSLDPKSTQFKNNIADALIELERRGFNPSVSASNILEGTISNAVTISTASLSGTITGTSGMTVNASAITGLIDATQIGSVNTTSFVGFINATQITSVNATSITGVIVSSQLVDGIIDSLNKFSAPLRDIPIFATAPSLPNAEYPVGTSYYNTGDSTFYTNVADVWTATTEGAATSGKLNYYFVGKVSTGTFIGLINAAQIGSVSAGTITGTITVSSGVTIEAGTITGSIASGGPLTIDVGVLTGTISSTGSVVVNGNSIQSLTVPGTAIINGDITGAKIASATITDAHISTLNVGKLTAGTASFSSITVLAYGGSKLTLDTTAIKLEASSTQYFQASATQVTIVRDGQVLTLNGAGINISTSGGAGSKAEFDAFKVRITGTASGAYGEFTATGIDLIAGTVGTKIAAGGIQLYGGSTGIGIGATTFAASPIRLSTSGLVLEKASILIGDGTRSISIQSGQQIIDQGQIIINGTTGTEPVVIRLSGVDKLRVNSGGDISFHDHVMFAAAKNLEHGDGLFSRVWSSNTSTGLTVYNDLSVLSGYAYKHAGNTGISGTRGVKDSAGNNQTVTLSGGLIVGWTT